MCGELAFGQVALAFDVGSSPRVRGTLFDAIVAGDRERFIPACAGNSSRAGPRAQRLSVHPRVCGELSAAASPSETNFGSSPRVRGTQRADGLVHQDDRFIPACAGNSHDGAHQGGQVQRFIPACAGNSRVGGPGETEQDGSSPRVRGTQDPRDRLQDGFRFIPACAGNSRPNRRHRPQTPGSSPRVRGTRTSKKLATPAAWFIPACAGNSNLARARRAPATVHPRVCGELLPLRQHLPEQLRFIPACAGNSPNTNPATTSPTVHPRVCGELRVRGGAGVGEGGSSPRVRGTRRERAQKRQDRRFIPACAGNSAWLALCAGLWTVHPRVCGELHLALALVVAETGSSPRVRGTRGSRTRCSRRVAVHPRVCGELIAVPRFAFPIAGSSPRVRGTRPRGRSSSPADRFIPACAGNSHRPRVHA